MVLHICYETLKENSSVSVSVMDEQYWWLYLTECKFSFHCGLQEAGILSPVQDGNNKPQIDSNKANNYKIVKEVGTFSHNVPPLQRLKIFKVV